MCIFGNSGGSGGQKPTAPKVAPAPKKGKVIEQGTETPVVGETPANITAIETARAALLKRQGIFGNIKTSPTGDTGYGRSAFSGGYATFG